MDQIVKRGRSINKGSNKRATTEDHKSKDRKVKLQLSTGKLPALSIQSKTIYIGYGNNAKLIAKYFQANGWKILDLEIDKFSAYFHFKWVQTLNDIVFTTFKEGQQIVNHISNIQIVASKSKLVATLKDYECKFKSLAFSSKDFFPETYRIDLTEEKLSQEEDVFLKRNCESDAWILKPVFANCGIGIKICTNSKKMKTEITRCELLRYMHRLKQAASQIKSGKSYTSSVFHAGLKKCIIQRYILNPLLLKGRKFDIRCYVLILNTSPLVAYFHHGYLRLSITEFTLDSIDDESKRFIHLTNAAVQKKHPDFQSQKEDTIWSMQKFEEYMYTTNSTSKESIQLLYHQMKKIFAHMMKCCEGKFDNRKGVFELMGCDILLDDALKPYLLEMNTNPALFTDTTTQGKIIPPIINESLDIVLQFNENQKVRDTFIQNPKSLKTSSFDLIYNEATAYCYK